MQRLILLGLNHTTAPLSVREKLAFTPDQRRAALEALRARFGACERVLLSTCNRVELYIARETHGQPRREELQAFLAEMRGVDLSEFESSLYEKSERAMVEHLFTVTSSLDSMVLGETQILGQVREAYDAACEAGTAGTMFHPLFQRATAVGKQVMTETMLGEGRLSVASVAVEYARRIFDVFSDKTVLNIGAGKMASLVLTNLAALKPGRLLICNRNAEKTVPLAEKFGGSPVAFDRLTDHLTAADIVVSSTGASEPIITRAVLEGAMKRRKYKPMFVIDIAVPRDVAEDAGEIDNVYLYNLDDLQRVVLTTRQERGSAALAAEKIVEENVRQFVLWHRTRQMGPIIDQLYKRSHALAQDEVAKVVTKLPNISLPERQHLEDLARRIVNKMLHDPIQMLRESEGPHGSGKQYVHAMEKLFKLGDRAGDAAEEPGSGGEDSPKA